MYEYMNQGETLIVSTMPHKPRHSALACSGVPWVLGHVHCVLCIIFTCITTTTIVVVVHMGILVLVASIRKLHPHVGHHGRNILPFSPGHCFANQRFYCVVIWKVYFQCQGRAWQLDSVSRVLHLTAVWQLDGHPYMYINLRSWDGRCVG